MPVPAPFRLLIAAPRPSGGVSCPSRAWSEAAYDLVESRNPAPEIQWLWPATLPHLLVALSAAPLEAAPAVLLLDAALAAGDDGPALLWEDEAGEPEPVSVAALARELAELGDDLAPAVVLAAVHGGQAAAVQDALSVAGGAALAVDGDAAPQEAGALAAAFALVEGAAANQRRLTLAAIAAALADPRSALRPDGPAPESTETPAWQRLPGPTEAGGLPAEPSGGWVGRTREHADLERALRLSEGEPVWLYGESGLGKTTLAAHLARWLVRIGGISRVVYSDLSAGGSPMEAALCDLGQSLSGAQAVRERPRNGNGLPDAAYSAARRCEAVERALADTATLVVWDGCEALLPGGACPLEQGDLAAWGETAARLLAVPGTRLLLLCDGETLPPVPALGAGQVLRLGPLAPADVATLADRALAPAYGAGLPAAAEALLAPLLDGHPLAWKTLGAAWATQPPGTVEEAASRLVVSPPDPVEDGSAPFERAYAVLWAGLSAAARAGLPALAVFGAGFMEPLGQTVLGDEAAWGEIRGLLVRSGLATEQRPKGFSVPYLRLHPALVRRLAAAAAAAPRAGLAEVHSQSYVGLLDWLIGIEGRSPEAVRAVVRLELPNLRRALEYLLTTASLDAVVEFGRRLQRFLDRLGLRGEQERLGRQIQAALEAAVPPDGALQRAGVQYLLAQAGQLEGNSRSGEAIVMLQQLCQRINAADGLSYGGDEAALDRGRAFGRLGRLLASGTRPDLALAALSQAQQLLEAIAAPGEDARRELGAVYEALGRVLLALLQFERAEAVLNKGLALLADAADEGARGTLLLHLGAVAAGRHQPELAAERLAAARADLAAAGDTAGLSAAMSQLAALAHTRGDLAEAERCYGEALALSQSADRDLRAAQLHLSLAQVAEQAEHGEDAEGHYAEAIRIYQSRQAQPALSMAESGLAELLLHRGDLAAARVHAEAARALAESVGNQAEPWRAYLLLQRIAAAEGDAPKAAELRRRTQEAFAGSPDAEGVREHWRPMIEAVVRAAKGEALSQEIVALLERLEASEEWQQLAAAIWLILDGERGEELWRNLDHIDALLVRQILDRLSGK